MPEPHHRDTDTPERIAERIHHRAICEQAHREMLSRFGALTVDNAVEAIRWQDARIDELIGGTP